MVVVDEGAGGESDTDENPRCEVRAVAKAWRAGGMIQDSGKGREAA